MAKNLEARPAVGANQPEGTNARPETPREILIALSGILLGITLASLDQTVVGTAMPRVIADLQGFEHYSWVATAYLLTSTATIPIAGKLGDLFGRKGVYLIAVVIFLAGSALCGAAQSMIWLVVARGFQGIGAGAMQANAFASIGEIFSGGAQRAKWQGLIAGVWGISSVFGPTLGGWLTDTAGWRWVFYINLPIGLVALYVIWRNLPNFRSSALTRSIDYAGSLTITGSVISLLLALSWVGGKDGWSQPQVWAGLLVAVGLLVVFVFIEKRAKEPVIPLDLFKYRTLNTSATLAFTVGAVMLGVLIYAPLFVQGVLGESAANSGTILTPLLLSVVFANILTGQTIARLGRVKPLALSGTVFLIIGTVLLLTIDAQTQSWVITLYLMVIGVGLGQVMPTMTISAQEVLPRARLGAGTAAIQFSRSIGSTLGVSIIGTVVTSNFYDNLIKVAPANTPPALLSRLQDPQVLVSAEARNQLGAIAAQFPNGTSLLANLLQNAKTALASSIHSGFIVVMVVALLALVAALLTPNLKLKLKDKAKAKPAEPAENLLTLD